MQEPVAKSSTAYMLSEISGLRRRIDGVQNDTLKALAGLESRTGGDAPQGLQSLCETIEDLRTSSRGELKQLEQLRRGCEESQARSHACTEELAQLRKELRESGSPRFGGEALDPMLEQALERMLEQRLRKIPNFGNRTQPVGVQQDLCQRDPEEDIISLAGTLDESLLEEHRDTSMNSLQALETKMQEELEKIRFHITAHLIHESPKVFALQQSVESQKTCMSDCWGRLESLQLRSSDQDLVLSALDAKMLAAADQQQQMAEQLSQSQESRIILEAKTAALSAQVEHHRQQLATSLQSMQSLVRKDLAELEASLSETLRSETANQKADIGCGWSQVGSEASTDCLDQTYPGTVEALQRVLRDSLESLERRVGEDLDRMRTLMVGHQHSLAVHERQAEERLAQQQAAATHALSMGDYVAEVERQVQQLCTSVLSQRSDQERAVSELRGQLEADMAASRSQIWRTQQACEQRIGELREVLTDQALLMERMCS